MSNIIAEDSSLQNISIENISTYLENRGWKRRNYPENRLILFDGPRDDKERSIILTLPANKNFQDSNELIARAINLLAAIEHSSPQQIIQQIQIFHQDTIYVRILLSEGVTPSLDATSHIIRGLRNLIAYSACMEREPRRYFQQPFREGKQQAQHFRFGYTFQGSFGFTVDSAIVDTHSLWFLSDESKYLPLERRVIERITRGFLFVLGAIQTQNSAVISKNYERGLNANMCNALAEMFKEIDNTEIEFSTTWSAGLRPSQDIATIGSIRLQSNAYRYLEEAAQYLEAAHKADEGNLMAGQHFEAALKVDEDNLIATPYLGTELKVNEDNLIEVAAVNGTIQELVSDDHLNRTAKVFSETYGKVLISIVPDSEWDRVICNAYRDRKPISVKGALIRKRKGGLWTLVHLRDLTVE